MFDQCPVGSKLLGLSLEVITLLQAPVSGHQSPEVIRLEVVRLV